MQSEDGNRRCLILANGTPPGKKAINYFSMQGFDYLICADGGANSAFRLGLTPGLIIGDLDSIKPEVYDYYQRKVKIIKYKRQNDTDVEKALKYVISKGYGEVILCGATGDRLDHSFCNVGVLLKFYNQIRVYLYHDKSIAYVISGLNFIKTIKGETISIYGIEPRTKFTSRGLKYPLEKVALPFGSRESTSNIALTGNLELSVSRGKGIIMRDFITVVKHGLLFNN